MAVLAMDRISIYARKKDRKAILELLQRKGAVEVRSERQANEAFSQTDTSSAIGIYDRNATLAMSAADTLTEAAKLPKMGSQMFTGREPISEKTFLDIAADAANTIQVATRIMALQKSIIEMRADIHRNQARITSLLPWETLDISMRSLGTTSTQVFIGVLPYETTETELVEELAKRMPDMGPVEVEVISKTPQQTCLFMLSHYKYGVRLETQLRSMGFSSPASPSKQPPPERIKMLKAENQELERDIETAQKELISYADKRHALLCTADYYLARAEKYRVLGSLWQSANVFVVSGFIPAEKSADLKTVLEGEYTVYVETRAPDEDEDVPVKLKNNAFAAPVEGVIEGYSLPKRGEVDPTTMTAMFYYVLFGLMLSDAAYGLLMTFGCAFLLLTRKNMENSAKNSVKMFMFSGISTTFWGILFGSFFGDAISVVSQTFFGRQITFAPVWFAPIDDPMRMLLFSMALGIIHLFAGLGMLIYQDVKNGKCKDAIYDGVFWLMLVGGLITALLSAEMFAEMVELNFVLPKIAGQAALIVAAIGGIGIIATSGRESRGVKRLLKGIYGIYNLSGYLSDILSYSRLLALGLATGVIASVFNQMGSMLGGGVIGAIFFTVVFLVGHSMNLAVNVLGAYVHTNRLQYVEFFGKFYEGGGVKFKPFTTQTKYIRIVEEKDHDI